MATGYMERITHVVVDELGIDPLRDGSWEAIQSITTYSEYVVTQNEENNIPLVAHNAYGDYRFWWIIQIYNAIPDPFRVKAGTVLRIPELTSVTSELVDLQTTVQTTRTVTI